ncbi:MAG: hypothetical protein HQ503_12155 [Rhodospirillales bacterium]|nr:hypothetical protein [Rhodospirillales bacterium]
MAKDTVTAAQRVSTAEEFLSALELRIGRLIQLSRLPNENPEKINFEYYRKFREMMSECLSFLIIIERRIDETTEPKRSDLMAKFNELTVAIWSTLLDGSLGFLRVIAERENLPIGTNHIFVQELKTLHDAGQILKQERYSTWVNENIMNRRKTAEKILTQIIDRAPHLLNLGGT